MKVGGNESATKFFQQNGGSAALHSKDPKIKYSSAAATKYKEELKKRAARDAKEYPNEVIVTDGADAGDGSNTPAGEPDDDFFSSWDKPAIKKPTPPISRTSTPPVVGRTGSPFLNANGKDIARASSPLAKAEDSETKAAASRITTSAALRKTPAASGPRKANVLGAKKTQKLGVKKVTADFIDFDEAEKKAKEEAERIEKLGYDPDAEDETTTKASASKTEASNIHAPVATTSAPRGGYGSSSHSREKSASEMERLGMGVKRLGFGQVGGAKAAAPAARNAGGFGSVGPIKAAPESTSPFSSPKTNRANCFQQPTRTASRATSLAGKRPSRRTRCLARASLTRRSRPRPSRGWWGSRARRPSRPTRTLAGPRRTTASRTMAILSRRPRTLCASLASRRPTTLTR